MSDEHVEVAREAGRQEAWLIGKRTVRAVLLAFVVFGLAIAVVSDRIYDLNVQSCTSRQEGRDGIRKLVVLAVGEQPQPGEDPKAAELRALVAPGGELGPIRC